MFGFAAEPVAWATIQAKTRKTTSTFALVGQIGDGLFMVDLLQLKSK
jgi:hypothetical protein